jgi:hypothetical protein
MIMSFDFGSNNIGQFKAHSAYKDGSGMGGGGMYFQQGKKRKDEPEEDLFELSEDKRDDEITFGSELNEKDIPQDTLFNNFVNWFRKKNN